MSGLSSENNAIIISIKKKTHDHGSTCSASTCHWGGLNLVGAMPWPKTGATHYFAQLRLLRQRRGNTRVGCLMGVT